MAAHLQSRTLWAERQVEEFLSLPLVSEFVFRSPQTVDGSQREVADFLVTCDAPGILFPKSARKTQLSVLQESCRRGPVSGRRRRLHS